MLALVTTATVVCSQCNSTLYVGVTSDLIKRIWQHKNDQVEGFTKTYQVHMLVWYEAHAEMESAINREKAIKEWKRLWKLDLIEAMNPEWNELAVMWEASDELCK